MAKEYDSSNARFAQSDPLFKKCCDDANCKPTRRQASKFRNKRGKAYTAFQAMPDTQVLALTTDKLQE